MTSSSPTPDPRAIPALPSKRDPRVDPKGGDKLKSKRALRDVFEIIPSGEFEFFVGWRDSGGCEWYCSATGWRKWAKDAEVINAAD